MWINKLVTSQTLYIPNDHTIDKVGDFSTGERVVFLIFEMSRSLAYENSDLVELHSNFLKVSLVFFFNHLLTYIPACHFPFCVLKGIMQEEWYFPFVCTICKPRSYHSSHFKFSQQHLGYISFKHSMILFVPMRKVQYH